MDNSFGIAVVTGSLMASLSSSLKLSGNLNFRRRGQRSLYDKLLRNEALASQVGLHPSGSGPTARAFPPSWTQNYIGKRHGHVIATLSSSNDRFILNSFFSGTQKLENSKVPASSSMYYTKKSRLVRKVYSLTASAQLSFDNGFGSFYSSSFDSVSGSLVQNPNTDKFFTITVPDYGKIRDVRVWVELIARNRIPYAHNFPTPTSGGFLGSTAFSVRSPNVSNVFGEPLLNNSSIVKGLLDYGTIGTLPDSGLNQYPLWIGKQIAINTSPTINFISSSYSSWNFDIDMRAVFTDEAPISSNPFLLNPLYTASYSTATPGSAVFLSGNSPNFVGLQLYGTTASLTASYSGNFYPWFVDRRIGLGNLSSSISSSYTSSQAPAGWLNGPVSAGFPTAGPGEFNTSPLANLGPNFVYPALGSMLDDVTMETMYFDQAKAVAYAASTALPYTSSFYSGVRKGLRGTEINGNWKFILRNSEDLYFRQVRLEILFDTGRDLGLKAHSIKFNKPVNVKSIPGTKSIIGIVSGAYFCPYNAGTSILYTVEREQHGRSVGITDDTGSFSFAVFTRLTGTLLSQASASAIPGLLNSYLHNEFRTPYIPISSGSINPVGSQFIQGSNGSLTSIVSSILSPDTLIDRANDMSSILARDQVYSQTTVDMLDAALSGSS